jgi:PAS domain S-box-containing protein
VVLPRNNKIVPKVKTITDRTVSDRHGLRWRVLIGEEAGMSDTFEQLMNGADGGLDLLRVLAENSFDSILIADASAEGKIIYANEASEKLTGHDRSSVIGEPHTTDSRPLALQPPQASVQASMVRYRLRRPHAAPSSPSRWLFPKASEVPMRVASATCIATQVVVA